MQKWWRQWREGPPQGHLLSASEGDRCALSQVWLCKDPWKDCLKQRLSALHSQGGQRCQPLLEDCLQHRGHGPLSPSTVLLVWSCSLHSVLLSVWSRLFYVFEIGPSFHSLMWLSFSRLCIRVLLQSDPEKSQFPEVVWLIAHSNFPPCWLLGAQSSCFFFTHCAFSIFANLF